MTGNPEEIKQALDDLLKSEGWAILRELITRQHGPEAQIAQFRVQLATLKPADVADQQASFAIIDAANRGALSVLDLPAGELRRLEAGEKPRPRLFDQFRRAGSRP